MDIQTLIKEAIKELVKDNFGGSNRQAIDQDTHETVTKSSAQIPLPNSENIVSPLTPLIKQLDEEKMEAIEILYCPPEEKDLHGEWMSKETLIKMVEEIDSNRNTISANLGHYEDTSLITIEKAWMNPVDCIIGETFVKEDTPLIKMKFHDERLWQARKDGVLMGISIGAVTIKEE